MHNKYRCLNTYIHFTLTNKHVIITHTLTSLFISISISVQGCILPSVLGSCKPDCTGKNPYDKVEDPLDCYSYYVCTESGDPSQHSVLCPAGSHFDPNSSDCGPTITPCENSCVQPPCHLSCSSATDVISDPFDCNVYHVCVAGVVTATYHCPSDKPYFDGVHCVWDESKCCSELCIPYCQPGVIQAPDPKNCSNYYICLEPGHPDEINHFTCEDNKVFDLSTASCTAGAQCRPICDSNSSGHPIITTTSSTITSTTPKPVPGNCMDSLTCLFQGYFPQCPTQCKPGYFYCVGAGVAGVLKQCPDGNVFNTNPSYPLCVSASNCPYYP